MDSFVQRHLNETTRIFFNQYDTPLGSTFSFLVCTLVRFAMV